MIDDLVVTEAHSPSELDTTRKKNKTGKKKEGIVDYYILIS
jgi:hypothetical protein